MTNFPTLDPELAAAVAVIPQLSFDDIPAARTTFDALISAAMADVSYDGVDLRELSVPGLLDGDPDVSIRFMTPTGSGASSLPVLLWIHGGGFAIGTAEGSDSFCLEAVRQLGIAVANVEYRLAPETAFPGPLNDCYAALSYVHSHSGELGIDPGAIAVGGQSAGGGLAAGTVLMARDKGEIPVAFQLLEIPELDDRLTTRSMTEFVDTPLWNRPNAINSWKYYLGESYTGPADPNVSPYAAPARATDLSNLPRTYLCTMEMDPLRDEGIAYALGLLHAGISVELHSFPGTFHGSALIATAEVSQRNLTEMLGALGRGLRASATSF